MKFGLFLCGLLLTFPVMAQDVIALSTPNKQGGMPLMQALNERHSARDFDEEKQIPMQVLSDLLWAGFGINRTDGKRTAPTARNVQDIDIYVATKEGVFLYDAVQNTLIEIISDDVRVKLGRQTDIIKKAPVVLIYVSDSSKLYGGLEEQRFVSALHTGSIYQNVGLFAAANGLNTFVIGSVNYQEIPALLKLKPEQKVQVIQPVGYPQKS